MADPAQVKHELKHILQQNQYRVYHEDHRNFLQVWWDKAKDWLGEQIAKLFHSYQPSDSLATIILMAIMMAMLILIALVVYLSIRTAKRKRAFNERPPLSAFSEQQWTSQGHLQEAYRHESEENYAPAVRHLFLALLLRFDEKGWLTAKSWKTNGEYYDELRKKDKVRADAFFALALLFDSVFYGEYQLPKDEYDTYRRDIMTWLHEAGKPEQADNGAKTNMPR